MISCPGCQTTTWDNTTYNGDYAGAEITSKRFSNMEFLNVGLNMQPFGVHGLRFG